MDWLTIRPTAIAGVQVVGSRRAGDQRGSFMRLFCEVELAPVLHGRRIVQANFSVTRDPGTIRGLHFQQPPHGEMKLVRCLRGRVLDVAVDLRAGSPTFLRWIARELAAEGADMMVIPEGCAHGFQVLEPDSELLYLHTYPYTPAAEGGVRWDDPRIAIPWPLPPRGLSTRDEAHPLIPADFGGIQA